MEITVCKAPGCDMAPYRGSRGHCRRHYSRLLKHGSFDLPHKLPCGPLLAHLRRNYPDDSQTKWADRLGVSRRRVEGWTGGAIRITLLDADKLANRLDVHPLDIWGKDYWLA